MPTSYKWRPLEDLPPDPSSLTDGELESLHEVWMDQRVELEQAGILQRFNEKLYREWAIETGIIERVYALDRGVTQTLIEKGIEAALIPHEANDKSPEMVARIIQDHADTLQGMFDFVKGQRELTIGYTKELHASLLQHQETYTAVDQFRREAEQPLEKGAYKALPNNSTRNDGSVHEYCPPEHVASEMDRMIALHAEHSKMGVPAEVEAAWLHHVFTQIHPFQDGNGRVARAIASIVLIKAEWFPLVVTRNVEYIDALEAADSGDLRPLVTLVAQSQKKALRQATDSVYELKPPQTVEEAIAAARDVLISQGKTGPREWARAKETANNLKDLTLRRLGDTGQQLSSQIALVNRAYSFVATHGEADTYQKEVAQVAEMLSYKANIKDYHQWLHLTLQSDKRIVVSFHTIGHRYVGLVGVTVSLIEDSASAPRPATDDVFQINYKEDPAETQKRFEPWLEKALVKALTLWRQSL